MTRAITKLEKQFILNVVKAANGTYLPVPRNLINDEKNIKKNQLNALINNLKAINIITVNLDIFDHCKVELTHRGKHAYRKILRDLAKQ